MPDAIFLAGAFERAEAQMLTEGLHAVCAELDESNETYNRERVLSFSACWCMRDTVRDIYEAFRESRVARSADSGAGGQAELRRRVFPRCMVVSFSRP